MSGIQVPLPRYDFYQTAEHVIAAVYIKGLDKVRDDIELRYSSSEVIIVKPGSEGKETMRLGPLFAGIKEEGCTARILSTKVELKLAKASPEQWPALLSTSTPIQTAAPSAPIPHPTLTASSSNSGPSVPASADGAAFDNIGLANTSGHIGGPQKIAAKKKNWDKLVETELTEKEDASDPNAGGDGALQKMFADIYANADADTKRAMIKSFTESGGTSLSTDWSSVGQGQVPIRPPDGMEARKY